MNKSSSAQVAQTYTCNSNGRDRITLRGNERDGYTVTTTRKACVYNQELQVSIALNARAQFMRLDLARECFSLSVQTCQTKELEVLG